MTERAGENDGRVERPDDLWRGVHADDFSFEFETEKRIIAPYRTVLAVRAALFRKEGAAPQRISLRPDGPKGSLI
jgi:hypothetical protein